MRLFPALAVSLLALSFAGCATAPTDSTPPNAAVEQAPAFATDEEALAAAQAAYAEYLAVSDQIAREGGANPERLEKVVDQRLLPSELTTLANFESRGIYMQGQSHFDTAHLQEVTDSKITIYLCLDTSDALLLDKNATVQSVQETRFPMVVSFLVTKNKVLKLSDSESWSGQNFC
jgi:hypothetical protein